MSSMTEGGMEHVRITSSSAQSRYVMASRESVDGMGAAVPTASRRFGSQSYFWSANWQQGERLADLDILIGGEHRPDDLNDLFVWLDSDD